MWFAVSERLASKQKKDSQSQIKPRIKYSEQASKLLLRGKSSQGRGSDKPEKALSSKAKRNKELKSRLNKNLPIEHMR